MSDVDHIVTLFQAQAPRELPCSGGCDHLEAEHVAFDLGLAAGEANEPEQVCPFPL